jgi:putative transposase
MKKLPLQPGSTVYYNHMQAEITKAVDLSSVMIQLVSSKEKMIVPIQDLRSEQDENSHKEKDHPNHLIGYTDKQWEEAKKRLNIIKPLLHPHRTTDEVEKIAIQHNIHRSTIYRWIELYEKAGELLVLVPKYTERGGKGRKRINPETELVIENVINDLYLHKQKLTPKQIYIEIKRKCLNAGIHVPHENTIRNRIKTIPDKQIFKTRESRRNAEKLYGNKDGKFPSGDTPLEVVQIDHTPIDLLIVDEQYREPLGRPTLALAIDVYSRMIVGFHISLESASYFTASQCISQLILPKEKVLRDLDVKGEWNVWGIPKVIHMDNGSEFRNKEMEKTCENFGITLEWRPVARPQFGAHIERLIGTSMKKVHELPGTTFSNIQERGEYKSEKEAALTLTEFERWFCEYVVNVYNKTIHSGIDMTPEKKYEIGIFGDEHTVGRGYPERIMDEESLRLAFLPSVERTIQQAGVSVDKIFYYHDVLRKWIKAKDKYGKGRKFTFKIDPRDISRIWFYDPEIKDFFPIPYRNVTYPHISRWELNKIKQYLAKKHIKDYDESVIFAAYDKMNHIQNEAQQKTKSARRAQEAKRIHTRKHKNDFPKKFKTSRISKSEIEKTAELDQKEIQPFDDIDINL